MKSTDVELWLQNILNVKCENTLSGLVEQLKWCTELQNFLEDLEADLREIDDVDKVLEIYPAVGQLLGRLCAMPAMLVIPHVYKPLMRNVLCIYSSKSSQKYENKTKPWALTQLRNSISYTRNYFPTLLLDKTGFTQGTLNKCCASKVCKKILVNSLEQKNGNIPQHSCIPVEEWNECPVLQLCELAKLCLHLLHVPQYSKLMVEIISSLSCRSMNKHVDHTLLEIGKVLSGRDSMHDCSAYDVCATLWLNHLPSLEFTTIHIATLFVSGRVKLNSGENSVHRYLMKACAKHACIYNVVFRMLEQMWYDSNKNWKLSNFISDLHGQARKYTWSKQHEAVLTLISHYPSYLRPVISLMQIHPTSLSQQACEKLLMQISVFFDSLTDLRCPELDFTTVQYGFWIDAAYVMSLCGSKQVLEPCCKIIWMSQGHELRFESTGIVELVEILKQLRGLLAKSYLRKDDIRFVLSLCGSHGDKYTLSPVLGKILLTFVVHLDGNKEITELVLEQATQCNSRITNLESFLYTIEAYLPFWSTGFSKGIWKSETLTDIVTYLASKLKMDDTSRVAYNQKGADYCDSEIKTLLQRRTSEAIQTLKAVAKEKCS